MTRTTTAIQWVLAAGLSVQLAFSAEPSAHSRIDVGASFLFSQAVQGGGMKKGTYFPRLDAFGRNSAGGLIFTIASGPKKETTAVVNQTIYALAADACVVDVVNGTALMSGTSCGQSLPESWTIENPRGGVRTCMLMQPATERVSVPSGEFNTTRIECREKAGTPEQHRVTVYWYAPTIGAMVKAVHRTLDSAGTEISSITEQLVNYQPK